MAGDSTFVIHTLAVLSLAGSVFRAVTLGLFGLFLLTAGVAAALNAGVRLRQAVALVGEDSAAARRRVLGDAYMDAIEQIRRTIPPGGEYLLVDGAEERQWAPYWVRFDLAPRRARLVGALRDRPDPDRLAQRMPASSRWVVIAFYGQPPVLIDREAFLLRLREAGGPL